MEDEYLITVCQGPPKCELVGEDAIQAQLSGCPLCTRIYGDGSGREETVEPSLNN